MLYTPSVFLCVLGFIHFALFGAMIVVNVFIQDTEPGQGSRTTVSRILWGCNIFRLFLVMCLVNVILFITGLAGIGKVIRDGF